VGIEQLDDCRRAHAEQTRANVGQVRDEDALIGFAGGL